MFKTRFTELIGIEHPIMQGGMQHLGVPQLAAAVSNAGGLGTINITIYPEMDDLRAAVKKTKELTDKPFAVNISLAPGLNMGEKIHQYIDVCGEEGVKVIETAGQNPSEFVPHIKEAGIKLIHKCPGVKYAKKAENFGADAVTIVGYEVAGHPGLDELGSFILINRVAESVSIPVLAAGGVADGKGLLAALALGAEGVVMGTRFVASTECTIHQNFKDLIVNSKEIDTMTCQRSIKNMARYVKNEQSAKALEMEKAGAGLKELLPVISGALSKECYVSGDTQHCVFAMGPAAGLINEVKPVKAIIDDMISEAEAVYKRLGTLQA